MIQSQNEEMWHKIPTTYPVVPITNTFSAVTNPFTRPLPYGDLLLALCGNYHFSSQTENSLPLLNSLTIKGFWLYLSVTNLFICNWGNIITHMKQPNNTYYKTRKTHSLPFGKTSPWELFNYDLFFTLFAQFLSSI